MKKELIECLRKLRLTDGEIESVENIAPMMAETTEQEFVANVVLLIKYGYPKEDISSLLLINPNIFVLVPETLEKELKNIKNKFGDVEEALKQNPFLI